MSSMTLHLGDNLEIIPKISGAQLIYADMMYGEFDFGWVSLCRDALTDNGSMFVQTDQRSVAELKMHMDSVFGRGGFINWIIWPYDWGGRGRRNFAKKHDDILWYAKGKDYKFYPERVGIPKTTDGSLNPSGRDWKIPTDVWGDIGNFHTMSRERVRDRESSVRWQKPLKLMDRIVVPTTDEGDLVVDPFMGTGSTGVSCIRSRRRFVGIERDVNIFNIAKRRLEEYWSLGLDHY